MFNSRGQFFDAALSQAALLLDSGPTQYALAAAAPVAISTLTGWRVWAAGFGNGGNLDGLATNPGSAKATFTNGGASAGIDYRVNPNILVGFTAGGAEARFDVSDRYTHGSASGVNLGLYGMAMLGSGVYVQGVLSYGYYNNDIHRDLVGENIGPTENARGSFGSNLFGGRFEAGWKNTFGQVNLTPFASIQFDALSQNAYSEFTVVNGTTMPGIMGLHYSSHSVTSVPLSLGLQVDGSFPVGDGMTITPSARISWVHEFEFDPGDQRGVPRSPRPRLWRAGSRGRKGCRAGGCRLVGAVLAAVRPLRQLRRYVLRRGDHGRRFGRPQVQLLIPCQRRSDSLWSPSALTPFFWLVTNHIASNHTRNDLRVPSKIVAAVSDVFLRQARHRSHPPGGLVARHEISEISPRLNLPPGSACMICAMCCVEDATFSLIPAAQSLDPSACAGPLA